MGSNWIRRAGTARSARVRRGLLATYALLIGVVSLLRASAFERVSLLAEFGDKWAHFGMYALLALGCCWAWPERVEQRLGALAFLAAACTLYGLVLECLQGAIPALERTFSVGDILANALGAITGAGLWARVKLGEIATKGTKHT